MIPPDPHKPDQNAKIDLSSFTLVKTFLQEPDFAKRAAKALDVAGKVPFEFMGQQLIVTRKLFPFLTKTLRSDADVQHTVRNFDDSFFSKFPWEIAGTCNNLVASGLATTNFSESLLARCLEKRVLKSTNLALSWHIANHGGLWNMLTGAWHARPYLTPAGVRELRYTIQSTAFLNMTREIVSLAMDGALNPADGAKRMASLFQLQPSSFHKQADVPASVIERATHKAMPPGLLADAGALRRGVNMIKPFAANVMPVASLVLDGAAFQKAWRQYQRSSPDAAQNLVLASVFTTALTMVGSSITTVAMNTRTGPLVPKMTGRAGLFIMLFGTFGSTMIDVMAYSRNGAGAGTRETG